MAFAHYVGRKHAVAVASGTIGLLIALKASGIGPGHEVIATPYSWRETVHAIALAGATPVLADIDYWSGTLVPAKIEAAIRQNSGLIAEQILAGSPERDTDDEEPVEA